jgi:hypothetical protein
MCTNNEQLNNTMKNLQIIIIIIIKKKGKN